MKRQRQVKSTIIIHMHKIDSRLLRNTRSQRKIETDMYSILRSRPLTTIWLHTAAKLTRALPISFLNLSGAISPTIPAVKVWIMRVSSITCSHRTIISANQNASLDRAVALLNPKLLMIMPMDKHRYRECLNKEAKNWGKLVWSSTLTKPCSNRHRSSENLKRNYPKRAAVSLLTKNEHYHEMIKRSKKYRKTNWKSNKISKSNILCNE